MSGTPSFHDALNRASAGIVQLDKFQQTETEQRLQKYGHIANKSIQKVAMDGAFSSDDVQGSLSVIVSQIDTFIEDSKHAIRVLDEIGKIHPFVQIAVSAFKIALNFELTRRSNDEKVLALKIQMKEMMRTLYVLRDVESNDSAISQLLTDRLIKVADSINQCAEVCEAYQRQKLLVKFFASHKWEGKFTSVSEQFNEHSLKLQDDLSLHTNRGVTNANRMLHDIRSDLSALMRAVFETFRTREEAEILSFVSMHGGPDQVLRDDAYLRDLLTITRAKKEFQQSSGLGLPEKPLAAELQDVRRDVQKDVEDILTDNKKFFEQKFEAQRAQIERIRDTMVKEGDRIIANFTSGPHDLVVNKELHNVWRLSGWKTSVKAAHLVLALVDHFAQSASTEVDDTIDPLDVEAYAQLKGESWMMNTDRPSVSAKDQWALECVGVHHVQALIEAIDVDFSSFVSVTEINAFAAARPADWSLLHWLAYWSIGYRSTIQWYYDRIVVLLAQLELAARKTMPVNRQRVYNFLQQFPYVDQLLAGIRQANHEKSYSPHSRQSKLWAENFRSYVDSEERRMYDVLRRVSHHIDDESTLALVVSKTAPEQYILPITYLLLRRALDVFELSTSNILHDLELDTLKNSFDTSYSELRKRKEALQAILILQNRDISGYLHRAYHGMYSYIFESSGVQEGGYWENSPELLAAKADDLDLEVPYEERTAAALTFPSPSVLGPELRYLDEPLHQYKPQQMRPSTQKQRKARCTGEEGYSIAGLWNSIYTVYWEDGHSESESFGRIMIDSASIATRSLTGYGVDSVGDFQFMGQLQKNELTFWKDYGVGDPSTGILRPRVYEFIGSVNSSVEEIKGHWTYFDEVSPFLKTSTSQCSRLLDSEVGFASIFTDGTGGGHKIQAVTFTLRRTPEIALFKRAALLGRPSDLELAQNRIPALWHLALQSARYMVRHSSFSPSNLADRRCDRKTYLTIFVERIQNHDRISAEHWSAWKRLVEANILEDLRLWRALCSFYAEHCKIVHTMVSCAICGEEKIRSARYTCLLCSQHKGTTLDFCSSCITKSLTFKDATENVREHLPHSHHILQERLQVGLRYGHTMRSKAKLYVQDLQGSSDEQRRPNCASCHESITKPYWFCLDCKDKGENTYVCLVCNIALEKKLPWITQDRLDPEHNWSHTLILFPDASQEPRGPTATALPVSTIGERLDNLESILSQLKEYQNREDIPKEDKALPAHADSVSARMDALTTQLNSLEVLMKQMLKGQEQK